jgi:DNA-binding transcriptional LysR family regulator
MTGPDFLIPPEDCIVLRAFSQTRTLREAAALLDLDPAGLVRKVKQITAREPLLQKVKGKWVLTEMGRRAVYWVESSMASQRQVLNEKPRLRIATTMWMAEQIVMPNFRELEKSFNEKYLWSVRTGPRLEEDLLEGLSDYVIACHPPHDPNISHRKIAPEKWIIVIPRDWKKKFPKSESQWIEVLKSKPFIRHAEINPALIGEYGGNALDLGGLIVDNLISVRSAVEQGLGWGCVPEITVRASLKARQIVKLDLSVSLGGHVCLWWIRARKDMAQNIKVLENWLADDCSLSRDRP